jgi:hypothetical protein
VSERRFYLSALLLPLAVTSAAHLVSAWESRISPQSLGALGGIAVVVVFIGFFAIPPYLIFLLVVWTRFRKAPGPVLRRIALIAPLLIAAAFAPVFGFAGGWTDFRTFLTGAAVGAAWALAVGYTYVAAIELVRALGMWCGWVVRTQST